MRLTAKSSHRRYANVKHYEAFRDGKSCGLFETNSRTDELEKEEIQDICKVSNCDRLVLIWNARTGNCRKEVII